PSDAPSAPPSSGPAPSDAPSAPPSSGPAPSDAPSATPSSGPASSDAPSVPPSSGPAPSDAPSAPPSSGPASSTSPAALTTVAPTTAATTCLVGYCKNDGVCSIVNNERTCQCPVNWGGDHCEERAKIVRPKVVVQKDYDEDMRDNNSPAAQNFWLAFVRFMLAVFRRSSNPAFANARHTLILISLGPGSVITEFDDKISGPQVDTIETEAISSDIESGISNLASSNESFSNFTVSNVSSAVPSLCSNTSCSIYASCDNSSTNVSTLCTCNFGYRSDSNNSYPGYLCTQECSSTSCSTDETCMENIGANFTCNTITTVGPTVAPGTTAELSSTEAPRATEISSASTADIGSTETPESSAAPVSTETPGSPAAPVSTETPGSPEAPVSTETPGSPEA
ncbi:hypothetical protein BOX15_Mlig021149g2, partial [Macrostomum lignano]